MSQNGQNFNDYVVCPYNNAHMLMPNRVAVHLTRCGRNYPFSKLVRCKFNSTHLYSKVDMKKHVANCQDRDRVEDKLQPNKMPPSEESEAQKFSVESTEDWDNEPPAPTYDPLTHCDAAFIIRNPQGAPPAIRREFRQKERMRLLGFE